MEETMRGIVIITAALLVVSALDAQAAPHKTLHHAAHRQMASNSACIADQRRIADVIDANPYMGPQMRRLASEMRTRCLPGSSSSQSDSTPPPDSTPPTVYTPDTSGMNTPTNPTWPGFNQ
jgi:hypothetical protein